MVHHFKKHTIYISFIASLLESSIIITYISYNYIYKQKSWMHAFSQISIYENVSGALITKTKVLPTTLSVAENLPAATQSSAPRFLRPPRPPPRLRSAQYHSTSQLRHLTTTASTSTATATAITTTAYTRSTPTPVQGKLHSYLSIYIFFFNNLLYRKK